MKARFALLAVLASLCASCPLGVFANPAGGTVVQGTATFNSSGSQLTINTSATTLINWQSFNIGAGETTTFVQPSSSSVVWNQISDPHASQILGNLNANGYVVLQNPNGFYVGGSAAISTHGLVMTTSPSPAPDLSSGGAWSFSAPPPTASIVNYGRINMGNGGSAFLIANDIENNGTITAPSGTIGLYAGKQVLLSTRPDGRGLSAEVTLPEGSVNNAGQLIADAGTIALQAQVVNQGGLLQANSVQNINGSIELVAGDSVNLGASSVISAHGDTQGNSDGGNVVIQGGNHFSDAPGSTISIAGGAQGGNGGQLEISADSIGSIQSTIDGHAVNGFQGGVFTIDPTDLYLSQLGNLTPILNSGLYQINLDADGSIYVDTSLSLADPGGPALLTMTAGNNITLDNSCYISAGHNWSVSLSAGPQGLASAPAAGSDSISLGLNSYIQTQNGNINLFAANSVLVDPTVITLGNGGIQTRAGGSIDVTAQFGDVNTGGNSQGYKFKTAAPYYTVNPSLGGISTAAGGNVTITAGGDVTSFVPNSSNASGSSSAGAQDGGSGAFGANPGNVTITAGGNVYGHYVVANGVGTVTAGGDVGILNPTTTAQNAQLFALSLIKGSWTVNAGGNIYLQEVRNPNGAMNTTGTSRNHIFNYDPYSSLDLTAGEGVYITGADLPRAGGNSDEGTTPMIFPPSLYINAGSDGVNLENMLILYPSPYGDLHINSGGDLTFATDSSTGNGYPLIMSASSANQWVNPGSANDPGPFGQGNPLLQLNNPDPVTVNVAGSVENMTLYTPKQTQITVGGNMINSQFSGANLHPTDVTSIDVAGKIFNRSPYSFYTDANGVVIPVSLQSGAVPVGDLPSGVGASWDDIFSLAVNMNNLTSADIAYVNSLPQSQQLAQILYYAGAFNNTGLPGDQGFLYNPSTGRLGYNGTMTAGIEALMTGKLTVLHLVNGVPVYDSSTGQFVTDTVQWAPADAITSLYGFSHDPLFDSGIAHVVDPNNLPAVGAPNIQSPSIGFGIGGPGEFNVSAGSLALGNSLGIISYGLETVAGSKRSDYADLAPVTPSGATVNVTVDGDLSMLTSTIASLTGGSVNVTAASLDLGSTELPPNSGIVNPLAYGIYTGWSGDVNVTATTGNVNIDGSRIAAYDGGNVSVSSLQGNVDVGSGGNTQASIYHAFLDPKTSAYYNNFFGSGILSYCYFDSSLIPGAASLPGNITVLTPQGKITATLGGIVQEALNGNTTPGPEITLSAGSPGYAEDIDLGSSGVIGGAVNVTATGNISGLIISRQDANINAAQNFSGTLLSGGTANLSAGGTVSGTVIGVVAANVSGGAGISAQVLSQKADVGGQAQDTLGATTSASSTSQSAAQQSTSDTKQMASGDMSGGDDENKKKLGKQPALVRRTGRVTVILPKAS